MAFFDALLDASVVFSFDRSGFERHARRFVAADTRVSMQGKTALVTGANSGLGFATARGLAALGATVHLLCRDEGRGRAALDALTRELPSADLHLHRLDVSLLADVRRFVEAARRDGDDAACTPRSCRCRRSGATSHASTGSWRTRRRSGPR